MRTSPTAPWATYFCIADSWSTTELVAQPYAASTRAMRDFDEFYAEHRDEIGRALVFVLGDQSLGFEAVDEAMVKAFQKWDEVSRMDSPAGWVFVAGKRWGLSWRRGRRRERKREELVTSLEPALPGQSIADYVDLTEALKVLPPDQRTVVACRFSLGMSVSETAEVLGIKEGTVKSRLSRSVVQLREIMVEEEL